MTSWRPDEPEDDDSNEPLLDNFLEVVTCFPLPGSPSIAGIHAAISGDASAFWLEANYDEDETSSLRSGLSDSILITKLNDPRNELIGETDTEVYVGIIPAHSKLIRTVDNDFRRSLGRKSNPYHAISLYIQELLRQARQEDDSLGAIPIFLQRAPMEPDYHYFLDETDNRIDVQVMLASAVYTPQIRSIQSTYLERYIGEAFIDPAFRAVDTNTIEGINRCLWLAAQFAEDSAIAPSLEELVTGIAAGEFDRERATEYSLPLVEHILFERDSQR